MYSGGFFELQLEKSRSFFFFWGTHIPFFTMGACHESLAVHVYRNHELPPFFLEALAAIVTDPDVTGQYHTAYGKDNQNDQH